MHTQSETKILPYSARQLYDLVIDIERYPEFLPWCIGARINEKKADHLSADVIVGYKMFRERFTSRVHFTRPDVIEVEYLKGPMRHLHNSWRFTDIEGGGCRVDFLVSFEFSSKVFEALVDQFFNLAFSRMVDAFEKRAQKLYGGF